MVLANALSLLRVPWSPSFSLRVAAAVRKTIADPDVRALGVAAYRVAAQTIPRLAAVLERPDAEPLPPYQERMLDEAREVLRVRQLLHEQISGRSKT